MTEATDFAVGVDVVVIPDPAGEFSDECLSVSLAISPTSVDSSSSIATVDITEWPRQISLLAAKVQLIFDDNREVCASPDVALEDFADQATSLWQTIFTDGAKSRGAGFRALIETLTGKNATALQYHPLVSK